MTFSRPVLALLGTTWLVCGVVIGLNPAPGDSAKAQAIPMVGWLLAAGALYVLYQAVVGPKRTAKTGPPRHASDRDATSNGDVVKLGLAGLFCGVMGVFLLLTGIAEGHATHTCLGVVFLSAVVPLIAHVSSLARDRVGRS